MLVLIKETPRLKQNMKRCRHKIFYSGTALGTLMFSSPRYAREIAKQKTFSVKGHEEFFCSETKNGHYC